MAVKKVYVGLLGFGNIGSSVYKVLTEGMSAITHKENLEIVVKKILEKDIEKARKIVDEKLLTDDFSRILDDDDISVVAEFIGGTQPALDYALALLKKGKSFVTANKELLATHWHRLDKAARESGAGLYYEASVAGGIPVIKTINESLQANNITNIYGIINGTTNHILTDMSEKGRSFPEALSDAQKLGLAEPDPSYDIDGLDAVYKLSILASLAFHAKVPVGRIFHEGIRTVTTEDIANAAELGYVIKLLAIGKKNGASIEARVHPTMIPQSHPLASVKGAFNAIFIKGDPVGDLMLYGRGAGGPPTASAVVSDIITACQAQKHRYTTFYNDDEPSKEVTFVSDWETEYYIRLSAANQPGVLAKISGVFGKFGVNLASVKQRRPNGGSAPVIFVTYMAHEHAMMAAIAEISKLPEVAKVDNVIRIEN
ncbi:MAG: homoserine dehydrogenase [Bacillota bacterium]|nr:homoserine dehydrogenase [Bacillota bacterium]